MNKKIAIITTIIGLLFMSFVIIFMNKSIAKSENASMAGMPGMSDNKNMKTEKSQEVHDMDQPGLEKLLNHTDVIIVDVREPNLYNEGHIPHSINIPFAEFQNRFKELDPNKNIILVCHMGEMGEASGQFLLQQGFQHVSNLSGGMAQWTGPVEN